MNRRKTPGYGLDELLPLIKKTFGEQYEGEYAIITSVKKPDQCLYNLYANPVSTPNLAYNPAVRDGFKFEVQSTREEQAIFDTPEDAYDLLLAINDPDYRTTAIYRKIGQPAAIVKENTVAIRIRDDFPSAGEINNAFKPLKARPTYVTLEDGRITPQKTGSRGRQTSTESQKKLLAKVMLKFNQKTRTA